MSAKRGRVPGTPSAIPATAKPLRLRNVTLNLEGVPMNVIEHEPEHYDPFPEVLHYTLTPG